MNTCPDSRCGCLDRRQFLKLAAAATVSTALSSPVRSIAGPFEPKDTADHFVPAEKKLAPDWIAALTQRGEPEWFSGDDLHQIGMPIGGICTGQLYLAGDGRLEHWDIFNEASEEGRPRTNYQAYPAPIARVQQGFAVQVRAGGKRETRTLDRNGFPQVRFRGEYPIGGVEYKDPAFPLGISLEAFSPFIPLNSNDSSLPATILQFTVHNTSDRTAEARLAGMLQNAVCALSADSFDGVRGNQFQFSDTLAMVSANAASVSSKPVRQRPTIVLADFEQDHYGDWKTEGSAAGQKPSSGTFPHQQPVSGFLGKGLVNTFVGGDDPHGKLISPDFILERPFLNFLIGGGSHRTRTCMNLLIDNQAVHTATGNNNEKLIWKSWEVREFEGKKARLEIVDAQSGPWGHINVDQIELSDAPRKQREGSLEQQPDFGTMGLALLGDRRGLIGSADVAGNQLSEWLDRAPSPARRSKPARKPFQEPLVGAVGKRFRLRPGEKQTLSFLMTWHFGNRPEHGNHYATRFQDAWAVGQYVADNFDRLAAQTRLWRDTWYDSTLPFWLLDRLFAPVSILASATCQRWANGRFWAWEGVRCCAGTCAHVWNYAHALARLFPDLERTVREMQDFDKGFVEATGAINFRGESNDFWAGDSQGGTALKCLREHQMSRDGGFLKSNWPRIRKSVEFLIREDGNNDGLIEGSQHNTYDINFFGANTMVGSLYLGALRATEEMAKEVGDLEFARRCRQLFNQGSRLTVERLFNGEFFIQQVDLAKHPKHQYADGCLADQLFGQGWAHQVGLGYLYPREKVISALKAIWTYNWAPDIGPQNKAHPPQRWFARPGEAGLFTCTWPRSKHLGPESVLYRDEIWTGIEYQVAGHMAWEGMITEALAICRGVHERYHPSKQNPWNEVECGDHYARAMASHGVFLALCGFESHGPNGSIGFAPRLCPENFRGAFTTAGAWGTFRQEISGLQLHATMEVKWGALKTRSLSVELPEGARLAQVTLHLQESPVTVQARQDGRRVVIMPAAELDVRPGSPLTARITCTG